MELKFERIYKSHCRPFEFKSHLYGIEIKLVFVSTVLQLTFKSHLYGIEIAH